MNISIASEGTQVSGHFGHCESYVIYEVKEGKVINKTIKPNPGHRPGYLPVFLKELGVDVIIAGGMGAAAQQLFQEHNIEVFVGIEGQCDDVIEQFIKGELTSTGSVCSEHEHEGDCSH